MGWQADEGLEHEGYLVAVEGKDGAWRELGYELPWNPPLGAAEWHPVSTVQVGCECGWRSPRLAAPAGTQWAPYTVDAPEAFEDLARAIWLAHIEQVRLERASRPPAGHAERPSEHAANHVDVAPQVAHARRPGTRPTVIDLDTDSRRIVALARSFPSLRDADGLEPWDPLAFARWLRSGAATSGRAHAGRFVLAVWGGNNEALDDPEVFGLSGFDAAAAFHVWDEPHARAFHAWAADPWYP